MKKEKLRVDRQIVRASMAMGVDEAILRSASRLALHTESPSTTYPLLYQYVIERHTDTPRGRERLLMERERESEG